MCKTENVLKVLGLKAVKNDSTANSDKGKIWSTSNSDKAYLWLLGHFLALQRAGKGLVC